MPDKTSYHVLIYGCPYEDGMKVKKPFKRFSTPMYGSKGDEDSLIFIGFEYDRIYGLFNNVRKIYSGKLTLSGAEPPGKIIDKFNKLYPDQEGKRYALIQNVYTSHYSCGKIICGYPIVFNREDYEQNNKDIDSIIDEHDYDISIKGSKLQLISTSGGHNMEDQEDYYVCKTIADLNENECDENCEDLAKTIHTTHQSIRLPPRAAILREIKKIDNDLEISEFPVLTTTQLMCYCCT